MDGADRNGVVDPGRTDVLYLHDAMPPGVSPADYEIVWQIALAKLAALVEEG